MQLSIIIPIYNVEDYIPSCIDSILNQNFPDFELLLINDGSTDNSGVICDTYAEKDKRVKVFHQKNAGVSVARTLGLEMAHGEWICFVDGDDKLVRNSLLAIMKEAESKQPEILIARSFRFEHQKKTEEKYKFNRSFLEKSFSGYDLIKTKAYKKGSVWGGLFKHSFLRQNKIQFPKGLRNGEDGIFVSLCYVYARKIRFTDTDFYLVNERQGSASRNWTFDRVAKMVDNLKFLNDYIDENPSLNREQKSILAYTIYSMVSAIFNNFYFCCTVKNCMNLRKEVKKHLKSTIDTGDIPLSKGKIRLLNFSLNLYIAMVLFNQWKRNLKNK